MTPTASTATGSPYLGTKAKSIQRRATKEQAADYGLKAKSLRYDLQRAAQRLMYDRDANKQARVCGCNRNVKSDRVSIYRTTTGDGARFANLITCGSVWACPICSAKITEKRRVELQDALSAWSKQGGAIYMQTLTFPHEADMPLEELKAKFAKALQSFKNSQAYKSTKEDHGRIGSVRSLEITHGVNGWHPHTHELIFAKPGMLDDGTGAELRDAWIKALLKSGLGSQQKLDAMLEYAYDLQGAEHAAQYVAKFGKEVDEWSSARELTKSHSKIGVRTVGGNVHATPFQLLFWYLNGDAESGAKFVEYARHMQGKRMLFWSPGLRKELGLLDELTDEDVAAEDDKLPTEEFVCELTESNWKLVLSRNARGQLLHWAALYGVDGVTRFMEELAESPRTHSGLFFPWSQPRIFH